MRGKSESTKKVIRLYDELRAKGMSHPEIAKYCNVSVPHYYKILEEIAKERGVTKKELLGRVHKEHAAFVHAPNKALSAMEPEDFYRHCDTVIAEIDEMLINVKRFINEVNEECEVEE